MRTRYKYNQPAMARAAVLLFVATMLALIACDDSSTNQLPARTMTGSPRTFAMGFSSLPAELTDAGYRRAFELAATTGEMILIQRTPPWEELIAGNVSNETAGATAREVDLAAEFGLDLFVAIDATQVAGDTSELAGLPPELLGAGFGDPNVRRAFVEYAQYVAKNYEPKYLALGVEVNSYQHEHPEDYEQFVSLYHEAYNAAKELSPDTLVFTVFQLEELQGLLPLDRPYLPQWHLIRRFEPQLDMLALSSYPQLVFRSADALPGNYYSQVQGFSDVPLAIASTGYSSETSDGAEGANEAQQAAYVLRLGDAAQELSMPLLVWLVAQDPSYAGDQPLDLAEHMGLLERDGQEKRAWSVWEGLSARPVSN